LCHYLVEYAGHKVVCKRVELFVIVSEFGNVLAFCAYVLVSVKVGDKALQEPFLAEVSELSFVILFYGIK